MSLQKSLIKTIRALDTMDNLIIKIAIKKLQEVKTNKTIEVNLNTLDIEAHMIMNSIANISITHVEDENIIHNRLIITISYNKENNSIELLFNPSLVPDLLKINLDQ